MKCIIAGSRSVDSMYDVEVAVRDSGWSDQILEVVSGGAMGADHVGEKWAHNRQRAVKVFPISKDDWDRVGKAAGPMRNRVMAEYADCAVIVWDGESRGSKNMIYEMERLDKPVWVHMLAPA